MKTLCEVFLFNLAQFSFIIDNPKQLILEKPTQHYMSKNRTIIDFPKNDISV